MAGMPGDVDVLRDTTASHHALLTWKTSVLWKGEGGPFVEDGKTGPGGSCDETPTAGGLLYHPGMYGISPLVEAVASCVVSAVSRVGGRML